MKRFEWFLFVWLLLLTAVCGYAVYRVEIAEYNLYSLDVTVIEPHELRHFQSLRELETFLELDTTNLLSYRGDFKCLNFAETLSHHAMESGYRVVVLEDAWACNVAVRHAYNMAYCIEEDTFYVIEPQSDRIIYKWSYTYADKVN